MVADLNNTKTALITGCGAGGIGQALAKEFNSKGFLVIATLLPWESRDHLEPYDIKCLDLDVTSEESTMELKSTVDKITGGKLDVLVNNAGICYTMPTTDTDVKEVEKMFAVNVFGPMRMVRHFHSMLIKAKGTVVNIGSIGGILPYVYGASYNASKAALVHYGNTLRVEMQPFGVKVVNVISGEVNTNILKSDINRALPADSPFAATNDLFVAHVKRNPNGMSPEEYARGVVNEVLRASPRAYFWHGAQTFIVWFGETFLWKTCWDSLFWRMFSMDKMVPKVANKKEI